MKMLFLICLFLSEVVLGCTPFISDILYYKGKRYEVSRELLKSYLMEQTRFLEPYERDFSGHHPHSYRARWIIQDNKLYLMGLYWLFRGEDLKKEKEVLEEQNGKKAIKIIDENGNIKQRRMIKSTRLLRILYPDQIYATPYDILGGIPGEIIPGEWFSGELKLSRRAGNIYEVYLTIKDGKVIKSSKELLFFEPGE